MSKSKKRSSMSMDESLDEDGTIPETSSRTPDRDEKCDDNLLMEMNNGEVGRKKVKTENLDTPVKSVEKYSSNDIMGLEFLPHVPMRHILHYLDINDKRNLRITSRRLKDILDSVMILRLEWNSRNTESFDPSKIESDHDIHFKYVQQIESGEGVNVIVQSLADVARALDQVSDKVVKISATSKLFINQSYQARGYSDVRKLIIQCLKFPSRIFFPNLRILKLKGILLLNMESGEFISNQLEELHLVDVQCSNGLKALLSACRGIKRLAIRHTHEENVLTTDFHMPNLRKLELADLDSPELLYIMTGSASTLTEICLDDVNIETLAKSDAEFPKITKLTVGYPGVCNEKECTYLMSKIAPNVQELKFIGGFDVIPHQPIPDFPKLEKLCLCANNILEEQAMDIVERSPNLKIVMLGNKTYHPAALSNVFSYQPGTMYIDAIPGETDNVKFLNALNGPSRKIEHLVFDDLEIHIPTLANCGLLKKLTELSIVDCYIHSGFENLLNECCTTLQRLTLQHGSAHISGEVSVFKSLKHISYLDVEADASLLNKLLKASETTLEKLTLAFRLKGDPNKIFSQFKLPKLKIFQVYPRPCDEVLNMFLEQLPGDVTLWLIEPEYMTVLQVFYPILLNMVSSTDLYVDVNKD